MSSKNAVTFIGDIHGCYDELLELCQRTLFDQVRAGEHLIFLGDLVDRGPQSAACVNLVRQLQMNYPDRVECIMGNHEDWHLRFYSHEEKHHKDGTKNPMHMIPEHRDAHQNMNVSHQEWLKDRPVYWQGFGFIAIHGGIPKNVKRWDDFLFKDNRSMTMRLRQVDGQDNMVTFAPNDEIVIKGTPWADRYDGRLGFAVYGHQVYTEVKTHEYAMGIDTGCCFGGKLTAARFLEGQTKPILTQIPARKNYFNYQFT